VILLTLPLLLRRRGINSYPSRGTKKSYTSSVGKKGLILLIVVLLILLLMGVVGLGFFSNESMEVSRENMIEDQIIARGIKSPRVLDAIRKVERHKFVPRELMPFAYADGPLPIGYGQTISQPYIVAYMTDELRLEPKDKVLEIGTGSGYQAAILGELAQEVYTIEIVEPLAKRSKERLEELGYKNVHVRHGDGYKGWPGEAPFDAIIVTAAPPKIPQALIDQLRSPGGRMIVPVGDYFQELVLIHKTASGIKRERKIPVRFVPMVRGSEKDAA